MKEKSIFAHIRCTFICFLPYFDRSTTMFGLGRVIAINDPVLLEHILKTNFENYEKGYILNSTLSKILGNGKNPKHIIVILRSTCTC